jgi:signal recognition particle GTPase
MGGKKELVLEANTRRNTLAERAGQQVSEIDAFIAEFSNMRKMMIKNLKGMDMDAMEADPDAPMQVCRYDIYICIYIYVYTSM